MIHYLFNNLFLEGNSNKEIKNPTKDNTTNNFHNFNFPINPENDYVLLYLLDLYNKVTL